MIHPMILPPSIAPGLELVERERRHLEALAEALGKLRAAGVPSASNRGGVSPETQATPAGAAVHDRRNRFLAPGIWTFLRCPVERGLSGAC